MSAQTLTYGCDTGRWKVQHDLDLEDRPALAQQIAEYVEQRLNDSDEIRRDIATELENSLRRTREDLSLLLRDIRNGDVDGDLETLEKLQSTISGIPDRVIHP